MRTDVKERPILFSAPMVRAILAGRKTVTRRIVKVAWHPSHGIDRCPYGAPGDRLFVKETWRAALDLDKYSPMQIGEKSINAGYSKPWAPLKYEADDVEVNRGSLRDFGDAWGKTRVSIYMPRWTSRITLEVTGVRVERLHAITESDAKAEGVDCHHHAVGADRPTYRASFSLLWRDINGDGSWKSNPWVWVVSFQRCT